MTCDILKHQNDFGVTAGAKEQDWSLYLAFPQELQAQSLDKDMM
jgi:hypothetical protein